jgi:DNA repair exonuclease SbcCD ATPase subunit
MGYKCHELSKTGEGLRFSYDGQQISRDHIRQTRIELSKTINVSPEIAKWTVFLDGEKISFNQLSHRDAVNLLMSSLGQPPWSEIHEKSKTVLSGFKRQSEQSEASYRTSFDSWTALTRKVQESQSDLDAESAAFEKQKIEFGEFQLGLSRKIDALSADKAKIISEMSAIKKRLKAIENEKATEYHALTIKKAEIEREADERREAADKATAKAAKFGQKLSQLKNDLNEMQSEPENCPKCGQRWNKKHAETEINAKKTEIIGVESAAMVARQEKISADEELKRTLLRERDTARRLSALNVDSEVRNLGDQYEEKEEAVAGIDEKIGSLKRQGENGPDRSRLDKLAAILSDRKETAAEAKERLDALSRTMVEARESLKVVEYWNDAFSPSGIPNVILKRSIGPLNEVSRRISQVMTGGSLRVEYGTTRELASGRDRAELVIKAINKIGAKRFEGNSKGESGLANLIVAETLAEVGRVHQRIGYRWYDEVVKAQDQKVRRAVFSYMKEQAARLGILIFVVDHAPEAASYADHVLVVEKLSDRTAVNWAG